MVRDIWSLAVERSGRQLVLTWHVGHSATLDYFITSACAYACAYNYICVFIHTIYIYWYISLHQLLPFTFCSIRGYSVSCVSLFLTSMLWAHFTFPSFDPSMQPSVPMCPANHILVGLVTSLLSGSSCSSITWVPSLNLPPLVAKSSVNSASRALARHPPPSCFWPFPKPSPIKRYECHNAESRSTGLDEGGHA